MIFIFSREGDGSGVFTGIGDPSWVRCSGTVFLGPGPGPAPGPGQESAHICTQVTQRKALEVDVEDVQDDCRGFLG